MAEEEIVQKQKSKKNVKKSFYDVKAPLISTKISLYAASPEELEGKAVKLDLTKSLRGRSFELRLKIKNENGELIAVPVNLDLAGSYVRKSIRNGIDYVEESFEAECRDVFARIKPFLITRNKVSNSVKNALRVLARKTIEAHARTRTAREMFSEIMANKIQKELSVKLRKIYPLALCEIRRFDVLREKAETEIKGEPVSEMAKEAVESAVEEPVEGAAEEKPAKKKKSAKKE